MSASWRPDRGQVRVAEQAAHNADEAAESCAILLADAYLLEDPSIELLAMAYRAAKAEAAYRWAAHSDVLAQFNGANG